MSKSKAMVSRILDKRNFELTQTQLNFTSDPCHRDSFQCHRLAYLAFKCAARLEEKKKKRKLHFLGLQMRFNWAVPQQPASSFTLGTGFRSIFRLSISLSIQEKDY